MLDYNSVRKIRKIFVFFTVFYIILHLFCFSSVLALNYKPAKPEGPTVGVVDVEYSYKIVTQDTDSQWKFGWGDGSESGWLSLSDSSEMVIGAHSWSEPGFYDVKVKYRSKFGEETKWSNSLKVNVLDSSGEAASEFLNDSDGDGWDDIVEKFCGTNVSDSDSYPLDTDGDGVPDDSTYKNFTADLDDDNDGLSDKIEIELGSDPKNSGDVKSIKNKYDTHFLVDTDNDGVYDIFYITLLGDTSTAVDIDGDGQKDYVYDLEEDKLVKYQSGGDSEFAMLFQDFPLWFAVATVVIVTLLVIFFLFKIGVLYFYEEEPKE
ncbi:MAG: hypothetical protein V5A64_06870 [Candidatus Thermoplasmatota archaeon]